jgi:hypothetical protein
LEENIFLYLAILHNIIKMRNQTAIIILLNLVFQTGYSQIFLKPNYSLKSHETLEISKIEATTLETTVFLTVENRIANGYFCADKNISIIYPDGTHSRLISSSGIPVCPDTYRFKTIGEKLSFKLTFPPLKKDIQWIDLIEECSDNCFSFYGICLNSELNKKIDEASVLAENKQTDRALANFINIENSAQTKNSGIEGLLYLNIISLAKETGNNLKAEEWYGKLKASDIPRKDAYIKNLNSQGIVY